MEWTVGKLREQEVWKIFTWEYPGEYAVYNLPALETAREKGSGILEPDRREREYFSLYYQEKFVGYFHLYRQKEDSVMVGIGLAPAYCGRGYGEKCYKRIAEFVKEQNRVHYLDAEIQAFNRRAVRCCEKAGFVHTGRIIRKTDGKELIYCLMRLTL